VLRRLVAFLAAMLKLLLKQVENVYGLLSIAEMVVSSMSLGCILCSEQVAEGKVAVFENHNKRKLVQRVVCVAAAGAEGSAAHVNVVFKVK
jgi:hypothetical protein